MAKYMHDLSELADTIDDDGLSEEDLRKFLEDTLSDWDKEVKRVNSMVKKIKLSELATWFDKVSQHADVYGDWNLMSNNDDFSDEPDTTKYRAMTMKLCTIFRNHWKKNNFRLFHNLVMEPNSSAYMFITEMYAFWYKDKRYLLSKVEGQGDYCYTLTNLDYHNRQAAEDNDDWDYHEVGNLVKLSDKMRIVK